jgi:hypothetical protein
MNSFYTNIENKNGKYIGYVYNAANNAKLYETNLKETQEQALKDINIFLSTNNQVVGEDIITEFKNYREIIIKNNAAISKRCCGR